MPDALDPNVKNWLRVASVVLAAWALMLPLAMWVMQRNFDILTDELRVATQAQRVIDHRLDILEERQAETIRRLDGIDDHLRYEDKRNERLR